MGFARKLKRKHSDHTRQFRKQEKNYFHRHFIDRGFAVNGFGELQANSYIRHFQATPRKKK